MKRIFIITGADGFLGNNIIRKLECDRENQIRALVLPGSQARSLEGLNCNIYYGDVTKPATLGEVFTLPADAEVYVIHCAAIVYIKTKYNPLMQEVNVNGTLNVAKKTLEAGAKMVYVSSVHAITEKPDGEAMTEIDVFEPEKVEGQYAKTKAETANRLLAMTREEGLNACIVHPSGLIGPNDFGSSHLTQLVIDCINGRLVAGVKGGYDFADVRDVADGIISACFKGKKGECYILSNRYIEIKELLAAITAAGGKKPVKHILPMWIAKLTAPLAELYYALLKQPPLYTRYSLYTLGSNARFCNDKAKRELGYKTRPLEDTLRDSVAWLEEHVRIK